MNMKKIVMIIVAAALVALPATAQTAQEWQSTSVMQGAGSTLAPQVTAVGAASVGEMATTTETYSPAQAPSSTGPRRVGPPTPPGPIGDAVLPLLFFAAAFCGVVYLRRRKIAHGNARR